MFEHHARIPKDLQRLLQGRKFPMVVALQSIGLLVR